MSSISRRPSVAEAHLYIQVGGSDETTKSCGVELATRVQFHVPHAFAISLQQAGGVLERCAVEETDVDVTFECVDVPEWRVFDTCDRATIVHQFADIFSTLPHLRKPLLRDGPQLDRGVA